jgi:thiamine-monophosphate kinase
MSADASAHLQLGDGDEFDAIRAMLREWGARAVGIGDDAAVLAVPVGERLVASTDASVEGVHFRREWLSAREIGARATAAALSDLAAMAAAPLGLLLAIGVPRDWRGELDSIARGVGEMASSMSCPIVGGNVTRASELSLTITVLGSTAHPLRRDGAREGDMLFVTGALGGPGAALDAMLRGEQPLDAHRARFTSPRPRIAEARWLAERGARAAIDISDGLGADAGHLASASGVRIELALERIPRVDGVTAVVAGASGEEYELLVAFAPDVMPDTEVFRDTFGLALTPVGIAMRGSGAELVPTDGRVDQPRGHDHLS